MPRPDPEVRPARQVYPATCKLKVLVGIGVAHIAEEARHIGYARRLLEEGLSGVLGGQRRELPSQCRRVG